MFDSQPAILYIRLGGRVADSNGLWQRGKGTGIGSEKANLFYFVHIEGFWNVPANRFNPGPKDLIEKPRDPEWLTKHSLPSNDSKTSRCFV